MNKKSVIIEKNLNFFYENLRKYLDDPNLINKYLVIHDRKIIKSFGSFAEALKFSEGRLPENEFIIQQVIDEDEKINFLFSVGMDQHLT